MRKLITILLTIISISQGNSQVKVPISDAVNVAGRQRMLGQRMAKNKIFLFKHKNAKHAKKELQHTISTFRNGLKVLKDFAPTNAIKHRVEAEEYAFKTYKAEILNSSEESIDEIIKTNTLFLTICDELVTEIIEYSEFKSTEKHNNNHQYSIQQIAKATGAAGKLRYLTQRLTLYYAINDFDIQEIQPIEIETIIKTLDRNLNYLTILEFNTLEITEKINEIRNDWTDLKKTIYTNEKIDLNSSTITSTKLYKRCNKILDKANITAKLYTELNQF